MIENKNARSYEVSIWTLQDDFISVLKRSNLEQKGSIENAEITLKNDGENNFSFRIPMYIKQNGEFIENPIWYNVENGVLITSLRKLKVIFNKTSGTKEEKKLAGEAVFEFVITKVTESHEGYEKYCEVESEGLAFHELGKQGYSITLSGQDDVLVDFDGVPFENNINYWVEKVLGKPDDDPSPAWTYEIQMDWNKYDGRDSDKIYEEEYISDWSSAGVPIEVESAREKYELIEMSESNKYNLLQTIAEKFQVYTKYVYEYDDNYHIVGRKVIFYNNFLQEDEGFLDFTYKYDTTNISREMDGTDTITKMFVKDLNDAYSPSGVASISDTTANKSRENYLLNFDYLYEIGAISQEQYDEVSVFETQIGSINRKINNLNKRILSRELQLPELEAKRDTLNGNAEVGTTGVIQQCEENIEQSSALLLALTDGDGLIEITIDAPKILYVRTHKDSGTELQYGITTAPFGGIKIPTLKLFKNVDCSEEITSFQCKTDNDGNLKIISGLPTNLTNNVCYATFSYEPKLEYENVINSYTRRLNSAKKKYNALVKKIDKINKELDGDPDGATEAARNGLKKRLENQLAKKAKKLKEFEKLMGPALREGTWQPEDDYADCGEKEHFGISGNKVLRLLRNQNVEESSSNDNEDDDSSRVSINIGWSEYREDFDEEPAFYEYGPTLSEKHYLCVDLRARSRNGNPIYSSLYYKIKKDPNFLNEMSLIYTDSDEKEISGTENKINYWRYLTMGSGIEFAFLAKKSNGHLLIDNENSVIPVLMITDLTANSKELLDTNNHTKDYKVKNYARLGIVETVMEDNELKIRIKENTGIYFYGTRNDNSVVDVNDIFIEPSNTYTRVYPRIKVSSRYLKASEDTLKINLYDNLYENSSSVDEGDETTSATDNSIITLQENYDYYIRNDIDDYYITLKPEQIIKFGKNIFTPKDRNLNKTGQIFPADFIFSNTSLAVYLDAREIMKENSYPKTSYEITPSVIKEDFYKTAYNRLNQLIHINDPELKFKNVMGYITELTLNLENPDEDKIVVKNYKTKFEDLFSTIVAQTETMKKNTYLLDRVANGFNSQGGLSDEVLEDIMRRLDELSTPINTYRATIGPVVAYENYKPQIRSELSNIFEDAGKILAEVSSSVGEISSLNNENSLLLAGFLQGVEDAYTISSGNPICIKSTINNTKGSVITIDSEKGIYLGSTQEIRMFSGNTLLNGQNASAASTLFSKDRILFGVANQNEGTVVDLTKNHLIFGASDIYTINNGTVNINNEVGSKTGAAGFKITKDSIEFATGTATYNEGQQKYIYNNRNYFSMNNEGIKIANADQEANGALVKISKDGVCIGIAPDDNLSNDNLIVACKNIMNTGLNSYNGAKFQIYAPNFVVDKNGHMYANDADISGKIVADNGQIGSWKITDNGLYSDVITITENNTTSYYRHRFSANSNHDVVLSIYGPCDANGSNHHPTQAPFYVTKKGELYAKKGVLGEWILSENGLYSSQIEGQLELNMNNEDYQTYLTNFKRHRFASNQDLVLSIGAPIYTSADAQVQNGSKTIGQGKWNKAPFRVTEAGKLIATEAEISGGTITNTSTTTVQILGETRELENKLELSGTQIKITTDDIYLYSKEELIIQPNKIEILGKSGESSSSLFKISYTPSNTDTIDISCFGTSIITYSRPHFNATPIFNGVAVSANSALNDSNGDILRGIKKKIITNDKNNGDNSKTKTKSNGSIPLGLDPSNYTVLTVEVANYMCIPYHSVYNTDTHRWYCKIYNRDTGEIIKNTELDADIKIYYISTL